jgi:hypothetical protein
MELGKQLEYDLNIRLLREQDEISRTLLATPIYAMMVLLPNATHLTLNTNYCH